MAAKRKDHRPGTYVRDNEPGTLYGEEEPEDLLLIPPYITLPEDDGESWPVDPD